MSVLWDLIHAPYCILACGLNVQQECISNVTEQAVVMNTGESLGLEVNFPLPIWSLGWFFPLLSFDTSTLSPGSHLELARA